MVPRFDFAFLFGFSEDSELMLMGAPDVATAAGAMVTVRAALFDRLMDRSLSSLEAEPPW